MRKLRYVLAGILMLGLAFPVMTLADDDSDSDSDGRRCSNIGTWFGVVGLDVPIPTGVFWTVIGNSKNHGTNILEFPNNPDPTLGGFFYGAKKTTALRGNWHRTSKTTFAYTLMGFALDESNNMLGMVRFRGDVIMYRKCQYARITTMVDIFYPGMSPFKDDPFASFPYPGPEQWGRRAYVVAP